MKRKISGLALALFMTFAIEVVAGGEEAKPAITLEEIKNLLGMSLYLQGGYTFNFANPDSGNNEQRLFDKKANTFLLDLAQIQFAKDPAVGGIGYKLKVSMGETAKSIHSAGLGNPDDAFDLTEAYVDYVAALGSGLKLRFGKFATYLGAEVIEKVILIIDIVLFNYAVRLPTQALWPVINSLTHSRPTSTLSMRDVHGQ
jgi:hypothetical protein